MRIIVYSICWNERRMLPYFLRHYEQIADKIVIYDNYSDDNSADIIKRHPKAMLRYFDSSGKANESKEIYVKSNAWLEAKNIADWIIVVDTDEFVWHPQLRDYLKDCKARGITIPVPTGYEMVANQFPETTNQIYSEVNQGVRQSKFDKYSVFDPRKLHSINYGPGCHVVKNPRMQPMGDVKKEMTGELKLLHFKYLGFEYLERRYKELADRKSDFDKDCGYGGVYFLPREALQRKFEVAKRKRKLVVKNG